MRVSAAERTMNYAVLIVFSLIAIAPIVSIVTTALSPQTGAAPGIHLENLAEAWTVGGFGRSLGNSIQVHMNMSTTRVTTAGTEEGTTIRSRVRSGPAPSRAAASSRLVETVRNWARSQKVPKATDCAICGSAIAA